MRDLATLPKTNLHVHLENAVRPSTLRDVAARNGISLPEALSGDRCILTDFADFFVQNSNARACLVEAEDFPLPRLIGAGLKVTLNTDIPSMTGTRLTAEYTNARTVFGFDDAQLASIALTGVDASFATEPLQHALRREIKDWLATG